MGGASSSIMYMRSSSTTAAVEPAARDRVASDCAAVLLPLPMGPLMINTPGAVTRYASYDAIDPDYDSRRERWKSWQPQHDVHETVASELRGPTLDIGCGAGSP